MDGTGSNLDMGNADPLLRSRRFGSVLCVEAWLGPNFCLRIYPRIRTIFRDNIGSVVQ
jgi:hypothetical protein